MFLGKRKEVLRVLKVMGERVCVYGGEDWPHYCDCKYGGPNDKYPGGEDNGCPELAFIYSVVGLMTDFEWADIAKRGGHGFSDDVIKKVLGAMNDRLDEDKSCLCLGNLPCICTPTCSYPCGLADKDGCQCTGVPSVQPCGPLCKYPYTDEKVGGGENC